MSYVTWGCVRGFGPVRDSLSKAQADLRRDQKGCEKQGGYSDRRVYTVDAKGYIVDDDGQHVWPVSMSGGAVRVRR